MALRLDRWVPCLRTCEDVRQRASNYWLERWSTMTSLSALGLACLNGSQDRWSTSQCQLLADGEWIHGRALGRAGPSQDHYGT